MQDINLIFSIIVLIMSVVIHEVAHGYAASMLGDSTAKRLGRLTLNPLPHLDPIGSFFVPLLTHFASGFVFGWAKPVPYNPYNLRDKKWGEAKVAAAGPATNFLIAVIFGLMLRFQVFTPDSPASDIITLIVFLNIVLAAFNLVPIPPLDGSRILFSLLPYHLRYIQDAVEKYWLVGIVIFVFFMGGVLSPLIGLVFETITGIAP